MAKRMTEKDLEKIQSKIQLNFKNDQKITKISLPSSLTIEKKQVKKTGMNVVEIINSNKNATFEVTVSDTHFSLILKGAKLLSINQIFAILQYRKYEMFSYKKSWHNIINDILLETHIKLKAQGKSLPYFDDSVELTVFRQAPKLVDEDALTTMFKYIIDAFKRDDKKNIYGILAEDNPKIVHKIECYSEKGEHCLGIKIKLIEGEKKQKYSLEKILEK